MERCHVNSMKCLRSSIYNLIDGGITSDTQAAASGHLSYDATRIYSSEKLVRSGEPVFFLFFDWLNPFNVHFTYKLIRNNNPRLMQTLLIRADTN